MHKGERGKIPAGVQAHEPVPVHDAAERGLKQPIPDFKVGKQERALTILDPWDPMQMQNLSANVSYWGVRRMQEELSRACELCEQGASLSELLEPWVPPDQYYSITSAADAGLDKFQIARIRQGKDMIPGPGPGPIRLDR